MNKTIENNDKAQEAIGEVASKLKFTMLYSLGDIYSMLQDINNLDEVTTKEELEEALSCVECWDEVPPLDQLLEDTYYNVKTLEEAIELEVAK